MATPKRYWRLVFLGAFILTLAAVPACNEPPVPTEAQVLAALNEPRTDAEDEAFAVNGRRLFLRNNCHNCHGINGQATTAPGLRRLYVEPARLADGTALDRDPAYLARSILHPQAQVVAGYAQPMTNYARILSPQDVAAIIRYLHTFSPPPAAPPAADAEKDEPASVRETTSKPRP
jgi:mono/diheme cytochrome c family protein